MAVYRPKHSRVRDFRVDKPVGVGGGGMALRVKDSHGRFVVLKQLTKPDKARAAFEVELSNNAKALCSNKEYAICRSHLVLVTEYIEDNGDIFLAQEYRIGGSLRGVLTKQKNLAYDKARAIFLSVILGLTALHKAGYAHRDIKPDNILFGHTLRDAALADFGIANHLHRQPAIPGYTTGYASPEQMRAFAAAEAQDVFSLGATIFEALCEVRPYERPTNEAENAAILDRSEGTVGITQFAAVPPAAAAAIDAALDKNPLARPTLRELYQAL